MLGRGTLSRITAERTPIMDKGSFGAGITRSPCLLCEHRAEDKNYCKMLPTCPIRIPTIKLAMPPSERPPTSPPQWTNICQFPGCARTCKNDYCSGVYGHKALVYTRKKRHPDRPDLWHLPILKGGMGNYLKNRVLTENKNDG